MRSILHVDMDAFYASVEIRDNPSLGGLPVVVGGDPEKRGVIAAASYAARKFGIHSAMPSITAVQLCPDLVFVPARHDLYAVVSQQIRGIFERYTPLVEPLALDEAFLDVTSSERLWGGGEHIGRLIKSNISTELGLTASVGVATNKFVAKLASDLDKPDGLVVIALDQIQSVLDPLPVTRIWGVGKAGGRQLEALGITTIRHLREQSASSLEKRFGAWGQHVWRLANGLDDRAVITDGEAKSISHETTFDQDIVEPEALTEVLLDLTEQVAARLRRHQRYAHTVQVKIRYGNFHTLTRAHTLRSGTNITREIWHTARTLLHRVLHEKPGPIRLLGITVTGLGDAHREQADLFEPDRGKQRELDGVADSINQRFGPRAVHRGLRNKGVRTL